MESGPYGSLEKRKERILTSWSFKGPEVRNQTRQIGLPLNLTHHP